jgi:Protein of unknown function (DUF3102)
VRPEFRERLSRAATQKWPKGLFAGDASAKERQHIMTSITEMVPKPTEALSSADAQLAEHANEIRRLGRRAIGDIIEIGRHLIEAKKLAGHGHWLPWLEREFGWKEQSARNFVNVAELAAKSPTVGDLDIDFRGLYLLAAPSTPAEVVEEVVALDRKVTTEDVARAIRARSREMSRAIRARKTSERIHEPNPAPVPNLPKPVKASPTRVANEILAQCPFGTWLPISKIATTVKVEDSLAKEALKDLGPEYVETRRNGGALEYRIDYPDQMQRNRLLDAKDQEIADLKKRIAELEVENAQLMERFTAPVVSSPPAAKTKSKTKTDSGDVTTH